MRIGVTLPFGAPDGPGRLPTWREMHAFATHAEAIGLDSLWVCDHFLSGPAGRPAEAIHEGWTIVAALAASTTTIELGQLVMCVSFRSPALLAKMAVTADGVSGGRLVLGLGAGWYDPEYLAFGLPADHRVARFEEALQIIGPLLRGERLTFADRYHQIRDAVLLPPPDRPIPILVAGNRLGQRLAGMRAALQAESRDPATLRRAVGMDCELTDPGQAGGGPFAGLAGELARAIGAYDRLGIDDLIVRLQPSTPAGIGPAGPRHKDSRPLTPGPPGKRSRLGTRAHLPL